MLKFNFANNWSKALLRFIRWVGLVYGTWYKIINDRMGVHRAWEAKRAFAPRLEIGIKNQIFLEKLEVGILIPIIDLILAMTVFLLVWNSHCTRDRFTVVVLCSDELAVHSCPFLCLQRWVAKVASGLLYCWSFYCVAITWEQIFKSSLYIAVAGILLHETVERRRLGR